MKETILFDINLKEQLILISIDCTLFFTDTFKQYLLNIYYVLCTMLVLIYISINVYDVLPNSLWKTMGER